jgi:hypothetical protein
VPLRARQPRSDRRRKETIEALIRAPNGLASEVDRAAVLSSEVERHTCSEEQLHIHRTGRPSFAVARSRLVRSARPGRPGG